MRRVSTPVRYIASILGTGLAILALTAVLLEIALRVANGVGLITPAERPTRPGTFYRDDNPVFGVWHPAHARFRATSECFDVEYASNSHGARDVERSISSPSPRVVVLGDSFVEGIGVEQGQRVTDLLEARTGIEHLNFGTAGSFSSVQEWKLYETLASRFDHDWVLLFAFPNNDLLENDPDRYWERDRYRPYLRRTSGQLELYYPMTFEEAQQRATGQLWWNRWYNAIFVYRLAAFLDTQVRVRRAQGPTGPHGYIGYEQFGEEDIERLFYSYRKIRDLAGHRELMIFTIPRLNDLLYSRESGYPDSLPQRLTEFAASEPGIHYTDLLPGFEADARDQGRELAEYFLPCDGHWTALGNRVAAEIVREVMAPLYAAGPADAREPRAPEPSS